MVRYRNSINNQRAGVPLELNRQEIGFSLWPTRMRAGLYLPQTEILTKNPWEAIESAINIRMDRRSKKLDICLSFLYQARDFYIAYETARTASRPLLLYYAFLNLAKAFIICRNVSGNLGNATHGLSEDRTGYSKAIIPARPDNGKGREIYDLFSRALGNQPLKREVKFRLTSELLPQIVIGHRLWAQAANKSERFKRAERVFFLHSPDNKTVWIVIDVRKSDLRMLNIKAHEFLQYSGFQEFNEVIPNMDGEDKTYTESICRLEQSTPTTYASNVAEALHKLPAFLRGRMWCIMRLCLLIDDTIFGRPLR
jgi:YaaC-like Protein